MSKILYIDAGHGSLDANGNYTTPPKNGKWFDHKKGKFHKGSIFYEGVFNRSLAQKFMYLAKQAGFHCVPVYDPIQDTALGKRVETANNYSKDVAGGKGIYLSFHSNASGVGTAKNKPIGEAFTVLVNITYQETIAGSPITRTELGRLKGFVEYRFIVSYLSSFYKMVDEEKIRQHVSPTASYF